MRKCICARGLVKLTQCKQSRWICLLFLVIFCPHLCSHLSETFQVEKYVFNLHLFGGSKKGHKKCFASFIESFVTSGFTSDVTSDCARATYILKNVAIKLERYVLMRIRRSARVFESIVIL